MLIKIIILVVQLLSIHADSVVVAPPKAEEPTATENATQ